MKKISLLIITCSFFGLLNSTALAKAQGPAWVCQLAGEMSGKRIGIIVSYQKLEGMGEIHCQSPMGKTEVYPVMLTMIGAGVGLGYANVESIQVFSGAIGLTEGPDQLAGKFKVGPTAGLSLIDQGIEADLAVAISNKGLALEVGFSGVEVRGAEVHLQGMVFFIDHAMMPASWE